MGISPTDETPAQTKPPLDFELPGLAEAIRRSRLPKVATAIPSWGWAGVSGQTLIVNPSGSPGRARDGLDVLTGVVAPRPRPAWRQGPLVTAVLRSALTGEPIS